MLAFAKSTVRKAAKPGLYLAAAASVLWLCVDLADGASDRFHNRLEQGKTNVVEPSEKVMESVTATAEKLWISIESNPGPSILALVLFIITVYVHKRRGATTVEAVKAAVLRAPPEVEEDPIFAKIRKQALEKEMYDTHDKLEVRMKELPNEINSAKASICQRENELRKATEAYRRALETYNAALAYCKKLTDESEEATMMMLEIEKHLK